MEFVGVGFTPPPPADTAQRYHRYQMTRLVPKPTGRSTRLDDYDYSQPGAYFVTICTHNRMMMFGDVADGEMGLNSLGEVVAETWQALPDRYAGIGLDAFVVMPNHVHAILFLGENQREGLKPSPTNSHGITEIVRGFKTFSARKINQIRESVGTPV